MSLTDDELRDLYTARPDAFVRVRNDLARALKKAGRRDDADDIASRRRPSAIAWSINQVAHQSPALVDAWEAAAGALRDAMQRAVAGDADAVRSAQAAERKATDALVSSARGHLGELGSKDGDAPAARIAATVRAAALDDDVARRLREGTLETDEVAAGFGFGFGELSIEDSRPARATASRASRTKRDAAAAKAEAEAAATRAAAEAKARKADAARAAAESTRLSSVADKAQRKVDDLRRQVEQLQDRLRDAERDARRARNEAERAAAAAARAETAAG
jgi:hypothetical protein